MNSCKNVASIKVVLCLLHGRHRYYIAVEMGGHSNAHLTSNNGMCLAVLWRTHDELAPPFALD